MAELASSTLCEKYDIHHGKSYTGNTNSNTENLSVYNYLFTTKNQHTSTTIDVSDLFRPVP